MTAFDAQPVDHPELTLELARCSSEPSAADKSRNLGALRGRLGLPVPTASGAAPPSAPPAGTAAQTSAGTAFAPWQQLLAVGVVTGAIGFFMGLGFERAPEPRRAVNAPVNAPLSAPISAPIAAPPPAIAAAPAPSAVADAAVRASPAQVRARSSAAHPANSQRGVIAASN